MSTVSTGVYTLAYQEGDVSTEAGTGRVNRA
jgi:hypothetical protein